MRRSRHSAVLTHGTGRDFKFPVKILRQNRYAPAPLFLVAALFILSGPIFWIGVEAPGNEQPFHLAENSDLFQQIYPSMHYGFGRLGQGDFPLWNNRQLCGTPFFADPRHAVLQPLNAVFLFFETSRAMALHSFIALSLMGFFFVLFMRSMGLRYIPAVLGGMVYMCCGATAAAMSRPSCVNVLVWLPLLCCLIREYLHRPTYPVLLAGGITTAFLLLSTIPVMIAAALVLSFGYGLTVWVADRPNGNELGRDKGYSRWVRLRGLVVMAFLGLLLACIQWVPTLAWLHGLDAPMKFIATITVSGEAPHTFRSLLAQLLEARGDHQPALAYLGISSLLLVPAALFHPVPRGERIFMFLAVFGLPLVALTGTRAPSSTGSLLVLMYVASFAASVLAALGVDRLFAARLDPRTPRLWGPLLLIGLVFILVFIVAPGSTRGRMIPFAVAILFFALFRTAWAGVISGLILVIFHFIDLNASTMNHQPHPFFTRGIGTVMEDRLTSLLHETALDGRVLVSTYPNNYHVHPNIGMSAGFRMAGAAGIPLTTEQQYWWDTLEQTRPLEGVSSVPAYTRVEELNMPSREASRNALLNVMAVRALATTSNSGFSVDETPGLQLRRRGGDADIHVYVNENAHPRVRWAHSWKIALETRAAVEALCAPGFNSRDECIIVPMDTALGHLVQVMPERPTVPEGTAVTRQAPSVLRLVEDEPEHVAVEVNNPEPGILILSDTYDPGWRAYVNGRPTPILRVNALFRGVALPPGDHIVDFQYRPRSFYIGAIITVSTVLFLLLWTAVRLFIPGRRKSRGLTVFS